MGIDAVGSHLIKGMGQIIDLPFKAFDWTIDHVRDWPQRPQKEYLNKLPTLHQIAERVTTGFMNYHQEILRHTSDWSHDVRKTAEKMAKYPFCVISFCKIGRALRDAICEKVIGNVAKTIAFLSFQIFHIIPYFLIISALMSVHFAYKRAPVFFLTCLMGATLATQLYFTYQLVQIGEYSMDMVNKSLDQNNLVSLAKKTAQAAMEGFKEIVDKYIPRQVAMKAWSRFKAGIYYITASYESEDRKV